MKKLRAATIIPSHLYVKRDADRQLKSVLDDMGRPGYVLVARQMGKTNLLLNAKRELCGPDDVFAYNDLSNPPLSPRDCFRNIIDTTVGAAGLTSACSGRIVEIRGRALSPDKEHEAELRELLRVVRGKLVVILDEIDALTTQPYSDTIFAQVRSIYFTRVNIEEFARLTYVLSGVAEPSELIKNSKLSPFNIGEKIYLEDFSRKEVAEFLDRAGLALSEAVLESAFRWVGGNPRMCWDLFSALEDELLKGESLGPTDVERVVRKLYLTSFDRPPVDHIRQLAETSPEIRNAVVEIRYGKGAEVSDGVKSKLYLAGITSSISEHPTIKNQTISEVLSEAWLRQVEKKVLGLLRIGGQHVDNRRYADAVEVLGEFLTEPSLAALDRVSALDYLATAHQRLGQYEDALRCLDQGRYSRDDLPRLYWRQELLRASCLYQLDRLEESKAAFDDIFEGATEDTTRLAAGLNSAGIAFTQGEPVELVLGRFEDILTRLAELTPPSDRLLVAALYNVAQVLRRSGRAVEAKARLAVARTKASQFEKVVVLIEQIKLAESAERVDLIATTAQLLEENAFGPGGDETSLMPLTHKAVADLLLVAFSDDISAFKRLLEYTAERPTEFVATHAAAIRSASNDPKTLNAFVAVALQTFGDRFPDTSYLYVKLATYWARRTLPCTPLFLSEIRKNPRKLDEVEVTIFRTLVIESFTRKDLTAAARLISDANVHRAFCKSEWFIVIDYFDMQLANLGSDRRRQLSVGKRLLEALEKADPEEAALPKEDLTYIQLATLRAVHQIDLPPMSQPAGKHGRNEVVTVRFTDGRRASGKYKRFVASIQAGLCTVEPS